MAATDLQSGSVYGSYSETANYFEEILREGPAKGHPRGTAEERSTVRNAGDGARHDGV